MQHLEFTQEVVDLSEYPSFDDRVIPEGIELTFGDLHGNPLKLIYLLLKEGFLTFEPKQDAHSDELISSEQQYQKLTAILLSTSPLTSLMIDEFLVLIRALKKRKSAPQTHLIRLLGDILSDRGRCDLFTLILFKRLNELKIHYEILISNHDKAFIEAIESDDFSHYQSELGYGHPQCRSLYELQRLVLNHPELLTVTHRYYQDAYLPYLKLISYCVNDHENMITLFTHAPIDIDVIEAISAKLNVIPPFEDNSLNDLAGSLDRINEAFHQRQSNLHDYWQDERLFIVEHQIFNVNNDRYKQPQEFASAELIPFYLLMWFRESKSALYQPQFESTHKGYFINYVHGHVGYAKHHDTQPNRYALDSLLGKPGITKGDYALIKTYGLDHQESRQT